MSNVKVLLSLYHLIKWRKRETFASFFLHGNSQRSVALQNLWLTRLLSIPPAGISCLHVHVIRMFLSVLNIEEPSVFGALLGLWHFLFLTPQQWHHATFINLFPPLSHWILLWKIPQRLDWNPQWQNKSEVTENSHLRIKESDSLSQQYFRVTGGVLSKGRSWWLKAWLALGHVLWWHLVLWTVTSGSGTPQLPSCLQITLMTKVVSTNRLKCS